MDTSRGYMVVPSVVTYCATKFYVSVLTLGLFLSQTKTNFGGIGGKW